MTNDFTLPDFDDLILTRLAEGWAEVEGIKAESVYEEPPETDIQISDLPGFVYTIMGPELQPYPQGQAGSFIFKGQYISHLVIWPVGITDENGIEGVTVNGIARPYRHHVREYFIANHPRLSTSSKAALGMVQDMTLQMSGVQSLPGPGGGSYHQILCTFIVTMRGIITQVS